MTRPCKYTSEAVAEIQRRYDQGESLWDIARERGIMPRSLGNVLRHRGFRFRTFKEAIAMRELHGRNRGRRKYAPEFIADIERRRAKGERLAEIARAVAIKPDTLRCAMRYHGIRLS
jgi:hypothetical protein